MEPSENQSTPVTKEKESTKVSPEIPTKIIIRMWPKTPILYPMALFALICCIVGSFSGVAPHVSKLKEHFEQQSLAQASTVDESVSEEALNEQVDEELQPDEELSTGESEESVAESSSISSSSINVEQTSEALVASLIVDRILGGLFLLLFAFSLFTLCLDLEVRWALVMFCVGIIVILGIYILEMQFDFLPELIENLFSLSPMATPQFYGAVFAIWVILMIISAFIVRFHYVKIESNEIIVVGGLLQREQRYSTFRMQYIKDIQDVFEYYLPMVNSGRLIITFPDERDSIVLDNVLQIDKVTDQLDHISGVMQVRT